MSAISLLPMPVVLQGSCSRLTPLEPRKNSSFLSIDAAIRLDFTAGVQKRRPVVDTLGYYSSKP